MPPSCQQVSGVGVGDEVTVGVFEEAGVGTIGDGGKVSSGVAGLVSLFVCGLHANNRDKKNIELIRKRYFKAGSMFQSKISRFLRTRFCVTEL